MFVRRMLASLKPDGHSATIMPRGVLFRRGKETPIRETFIKGDVIEANDLGCAPGPLAQRGSRPPATRAVSGDRPREPGPVMGSVPRRRPPAAD